MTEETVGAEFQRMGCSSVARADKSLPASLVCCGCGKHAFAGVESGVKNSAQVKLLAAAISWHLARPNKDAPLRYIVASSEAERPKLEAAFQLLAPYLKEIPVQIRIGSLPLPEEPADFPERKGWVKALNDPKRSTVPDRLRVLVDEKRAFRWYRALTGKTWSGRLRGLEICRSDAAGKITFNVGREGKNGRDSEPRTAFRRALKGRKLGDCSIEEARENIELLWVDDDLKKVSPSEHALESQVLAEDIKILIDGVPLIPVERDVPCQFPAQWWPGKQKRHVDALMKNGSVPWVAELKVLTGGQGNYYWEGIVQAALYRGFIRAAKWLDGWFVAKGLDRFQCAAVMVIPEPPSGRKHRLRPELEALARIFDVRLVEVPWPP